jgi:hypothetical protein
MVLDGLARMQGRITERQLPLAERCFPGISEFYARMPDKPLTFLQLLWAFEDSRRARPKCRKQSRR